VQGAEKDGVEGFFKGAMKGFAGLVVKPVVGVMDLTSKTAEGIKNTANYFDDKPNEKRSRPPRVFYGTEQYYKNFRL
jgi:vacuolar protein sorting-associated protein 13A/C